MSWWISGGICGEPRTGSGISWIRWSTPPHCKKHCRIRSSPWETTGMCCRCGRNSAPAYPDWFMTRALPARRCSSSRWPRWRWGTSWNSGNWRNSRRLPGSWRHYPLKWRPMPRPWRKPRSSWRSWISSLPRDCWAAGFSAWARRWTMKDTWRSSADVIRWLIRKR